MAAKFEISKDKAGKFQFHLKAANGEIIAASQGYETKENAAKGIESVKTNAASAAVVDLTETRARAQLERNFSSHATKYAVRAGETLRVSDRFPDGWVLGTRDDDDYILGVGAEVASQTAAASAQPRR